MKLNNTLATLCLFTLTTTGSSGTPLYLFDNMRGNHQLIVSYGAGGTVTEKFDVGDPESSNMILASRVFEKLEILQTRPPGVVMLPFTEMCSSLFVEKIRASNSIFVVPSAGHWTCLETEANVRIVRSHDPQGVPCALAGNSGQYEAIGCGVDTPWGPALGDSYGVGTFAGELVGNDHWSDTLPPCGTYEYWGGWMVTAQWQEPLSGEWRCPHNAIHPVGVGDGSGIKQYDLAWYPGGGGELGILWVQSPYGDGCKWLFAGGLTGLKWRFHVFNYDTDQHLLVERPPENTVGRTDLFCNI